MTAPSKPPYVELASSLRGLLYVHTVDSTHAEYGDRLGRLRSQFAGPIIRNGGYVDYAMA